LHSPFPLLCTSIFAFGYYGLFCLVSPKMVEEFKRYGLSKFRNLTGALELLGALGQLVGFKWLELQKIASLGLGLLMVLGVITRARIRDPLLLWLPALLLGGINFYLFFVLK
jgi:DoxX-like family